jgi:hypothetical protein
MSKTDEERPEPYTVFKIVKGKQIRYEYDLEKNVEVEVIPPRYFYRAYYWNYKFENTIDVRSTDDINAYIKAQKRVDKSKAKWHNANKGAN